MTLKLRRLLHLIIFILLGLLIRTTLVDVYFGAKDEKFRTLITGDHLLFDHIPLSNVSLLANILIETIETDPYFVHGFFAAHYLLRHIFPPPYLVVLFSFLHFFPSLSFPEDIMILARDEHNLNVLAGALYGPWLGTLLCCLLTGVACVITFSLVNFIRLISRPLLVKTVWSQKIALYNELVDTAKELEEVSEQLTTSLITSSRTPTSIIEVLRRRQEQLKRHHLETIFKSLKLQQEEFASGDTQECSLVERYLFGTTEEEANEVFLDVLVDRAFQCSSLASLLYATVHYPLMITVVAFTVGYLPYAFYGASKGVRMMTLAEKDLLKDQSLHFRFHLGVFFFLLWLTPFLLQMATLKRETYRNNLLLNRWHLRNVQRAMREVLFEVPADNERGGPPDDDNDDELQQENQLDQFDNLEIDLDFLLL